MTVHCVNYQLLTAKSLKRIQAIRDATSARLVWKETEPNVGVAQPLLGSVQTTLQAKIVDVSNDSASCLAFSSLLSPQKTKPQIGATKGRAITAAVGNPREPLIGEPTTTTKDTSRA